MQGSLNDPKTTLGYGVDMLKGGRRYFQIRGSCYPALGEEAHDDR